jgi:hypothetical protein
MPDGAHHILKLYAQSDPYSNGSYWFNPDTGVNPCMGVSAGNSLTYYTTDGSYICAVEDYTAGTKTIYLPDETKVSLITNGQVFQDRNGNKVTIAFNSGTTNRIGRCWTYHFHFSYNCDAVRLRDLDPWQLSKLYCAGQLYNSGTVWLRPSSGRRANYVAGTAGFRDFGLRIHPRSKLWNAIERYASRQVGKRLISTM